VLAVLEFRALFKKPLVTPTAILPLTEEAWGVLGGGLSGTHSVSLKYSRDFPELNSFVLLIIPVELVSLNG
jgi:hypothetical protein